jgi:MscS family membrane protein
VALTLLVAGLLGWLHGQLEGLGWNLPSDGPGVRDALLTLGLMWTLLRLKSALLQKLALEESLWHGRGDRERTAALDLIDKTVTGLVALLGGLAVLKLLGVSAAVLLTASGLGAAALGFGARTLVENLLSGLMLYVNRPFAVGDRIGLFSCELLSPDGELLYVPNGMFTHAAVLNPSRRPHRRLLLEMGVELGEREAAEALVEELRRWLGSHPLVKADLPQRVSWSGVSDGALQLRVEASLSEDAEAFYRLRQELLLEVKDQLARRGGRLAAKP